MFKISQNVLIIVQIKTLKFDLLNLDFLANFGGGSGILNHESRSIKVKKSEGIMNHIISQVVNHESWTKNK